MRSTPPILPLLPDELIIDNFAGGGGTSSGLEAAFGRPVDVAINHDPVALAMHRANHPSTRHLCESVWDVDPRSIKGPVGLVWLSPDCKHFSKAKGGAPVEKRIRGLAWVALRWAAIKRPRVIMLENVEEFVTWGPVVRHEDGGHRPCPRRKGREFNAFVNALRRQGYAVDWRELRACDYGAPTIRKRFFMIARLDGLPICWPEPTHGDPRRRDVISGRLLPWRTAAECIDWSLPTPSLFLSPEEARAIGVRRPLADATLRRVAKGVMRYVVDAAEPFIGGHHAAVQAFLVKYYGSDQDPRLLDPLHTVTTRDRFALVTVAGEQYAIADIGLRMLSPRELFRAQGFGDDYIIDRGIDEDGREIRLTKTEQVRMCGNSVCPPVARALVKANFQHEKAWRATA